MIKDKDGEDQLQIKTRMQIGENKLDDLIIDKTLKWEKAEITEINENYLDFKFKK